jgi:hypothetical protein
VWRFQHSWLGRWHLFRIFRTHNSASAYEIPISTISTRQRAHAAAMSSMSVGPVAPAHVLRSEDLYNEMRRRIAALEETLAKLPAVPGAPLDDNEIEEIKREIAKLKTLPPARPTLRARRSQRKVN